LLEAREVIRNGETPTQKSRSLFHFIRAGTFPLAPSKASSKEAVFHLKIGPRPSDPDDRTFLETGEPGKKEFDILLKMFIFEEDL
jgi:hypothetical protein